ncbi:MAG: GDSL-type esterase/lipase family protein [Candidatus Tritonobacter lacicola]|nr:GDSL-type esterase/lipase family protein [Candidatus Tritonobacter lacicola]
MKNYSKRIIAMVLSMVIFFGALETAARILGFHLKKAQWSSDRYVSHEHMGHIFKPDFQGWMYKKIATGFKKVPVNINSWGLRDDEFPLEKPEGEFRILCLGDSFTFGYLLPIEKSYPFKLEQCFAIKMPDIRVQVINAGIPAYEINRELALLKELGIKFSPDLVILQFQIMDPYGAIEYAHWKRTGVLGEEDNAGQKLWLPKLDLSATTELLRFLSYEVIRLLDLKKTPKGALHAKVYTPRDNKAWELYKQVLTKMVEFTREQKIPIILLVLPDKIQLYSGSNKPQRILKQYCAEQGIPVIDILPELKKVRNHRIDIVQDRHFNGLAYNIIAQELFKYITSQYLKEGPTSPRGKALKLGY